MSELVLAIDAGGSRGRASIYDRTGERRAHAERRWAARSPPELAPFGRELDPSAVRAAITSAIREAVGGVDGSIAAIAVTGARIACAFVGERETLYLGPSGDVRALLAGDLSDLDRDALYARTGRHPPWIFAPARLRWLEAARPDVLARVRAVLGFPGWVAWTLGAAPSTDATVAADLMMLDVARLAVAPVGHPDRWPPLRAPAAPVGEVSREVADATGLVTGTPIVCGAADTQLALVGAASEARTALVAGSSAPLVRVVDAPVRDPEARLWLDPHVAPGRWLLEANLGEMGSAHAWMTTEIMGLSEDDAGFGAFDALAARAPIGCRGASAHVGPRAMDLGRLSTGRPAALMTPFGETSLSAPPGRIELARAFFESCAFAAADGLAWLDALAPDDGPLLVVGGLARSDVLARILADALGRDVLVAPPDSTARGAAACAAVGAGWASDLAAASAAMAVELTRVAPRSDEEVVEAYEDARERWTEREAALEEA